MNVLCYLVSPRHKRLPQHPILDTSQLSSAPYSRYLSAYNLLTRQKTAFQNYHKITTEQVIPLYVNFS